MNLILLSSLFGCGIKCNVHVELLHALYFERKWDLVTVEPSFWSEPTTEFVFLLQISVCNPKASIQFWTNTSLTRYPPPNFLYCYTWAVLLESGCFGSWTKKIILKLIIFSFIWQIYEIWWFNVWPWVPMPSTLAVFSQNDEKIKL
jgi:hypothetical protein